MEDKKGRIIEEAKYYLESSKTLKEVAKELHISLRTLQLHIQKLPEINNDLYSLVLNKQKAAQIAGRKIGGQKGKRTVSYSYEKAQEIKNLIISHQLTYQEASLCTGISTSTIYDMVHSDFISEDDKLKLDLIATANKKKITVEEYQERHRKR